MHVGSSKRASWFASVSDDDDDDDDVRTMASSIINSAFWQRGGAGGGSSSFASAGGDSNNPSRMQQPRRIDVVIKKATAPISVASGQEESYPDGSIISDGGGDIFTVDFSNTGDPEHGAGGNQIGYGNETTRNVSEMEKAPTRNDRYFSGPPPTPSDMRALSTVTGGDSIGDVYTVEDLIRAQKRQHSNYRNYSDPPAGGGRRSTAGGNSNSGGEEHIGDLIWTSEMARGEGGSFVLDGTSFDGSTIATRPTTVADGGPSFISAYGGSAYGANNYDSNSSRPTAEAPSYIAYYASEDSSSNTTDVAVDNCGGATAGAAKRRRGPLSFAILGIVLLMAAAGTLIAGTCSRGACGSSRDKSTVGSIVDDEIIGPNAPTVAPTTTTPPQTSAPSLEAETLPQTPSSSPRDVDATDPPPTSAPTEAGNTPEPTPDPTAEPTDEPTDPPVSTSTPTGAAITPEPTPEATAQEPTTAPPTDPPVSTSAPTQAETTPEPTEAETSPEPTDESTSGRAVVDLPLATCEPCGEEDYCQSRMCVRGFCADEDGLRCNGVPCLDSVQCISGRCDPTAYNIFDKTCQEKVPDGEVCTSDSDCISNRCTLFTCIPS